VTDSTHLTAREWPRWPDFTQFKRQAKDLLKAYCGGDADAVAEVQRHERTPDPAAFALHDAQRVVARSYGFASWPKLKSYVEMIGNYRQPDPRADDDANRFLRLACITYFDGDRPSRRERARQLLDEKPHLASANIYSAAAVGNVAAVRDFLASSADVHAKGGPFDWEPLLYTAYSRLNSQAGEHSTLEVARLLLKHGADPNAGFLWDWGGPVPCLLTTLTGVLGLGEDDVNRGEGPLTQPPHQNWYEFARLLLDAGADPNDNQGLYNRMQYPGDEHLKLLLEYGLGKGQGGPWFKRFFQRWPLAREHAGYLPRTPADILVYQLRWAIGAGAINRVKLLVENGADVKGISISQYDASQEMADYLVAKGAQRIARTFSPAEELAAACERGDTDRVRELAASDPSLLDDPELLRSAAVEGRVESIRLLVELGMKVNGKASGTRSWPNDTSPLWWAAHAGQLDTVKLLVELGADVHFRDPNYDATPLASANYKGQRKVVEYLVQFAPISDAVRFGGLDRVRTLVREDPACVHVRDDAERTPLHFPNWDTRHGEEIIEILIAHGADPSAKDNQGRTPIDQMLQNGRQDLAVVLRRHGGDSA
jgi:ankyrin repeat protein